MTTGTTDDEPLDDQDKGPIVYQESKDFNSEPFLVNVYDNPQKRFVTFEIYGLDTQTRLHKVFTYQQFDNLFRFNAELMNPNRKPGRFHYVIERLVIGMDRNERKLRMGEKPTDEISQLPLYETNRKIPTGRMKLQARQRLRDSMDMLDLRREEAIAKKRAAGKERFLQDIQILKEEHRRLKEEQAAKIEQEQANRIKEKEAQEKREEEELKALEVRKTVRLKAVEVKEQRTEEQDEYELAQLRLRWKELDAKKALAIRQAKAQRAQIKQEEAEAAEQEFKRKHEMQVKRLNVWKRIDERVAQREDEWLTKLLSRKADDQRAEKFRRERNQEFLQECAVARAPIFEQQLQRTLEREAAKKAEEEATRAYFDERKIPKRVRRRERKPTKVEKPEKSGKKAKGGDEDGEKQEKGKKGKKEEKAKEGEDEALAKVEKVLDSVEAKMRAEMEEERHRARVDIQRQERIAKKMEAWLKAEVNRMRQVREAHRDAQFEEQRAGQERHLIYREKAEDKKANDERKKQQAERLARLRASNLERLEENIMAKYHAGQVPHPKRQADAW
eukprot:CAMPEP_0117480110 /NCGR_PEP_ID=MMETSP0784-20121206/12225_1 /TAXON_ID=39447 /ORGANISM="" /LENGTH=558 /DNA_ID=CAMNT_0005274545 /DNA_START=51 /DNA_END=1724 /DNA_ORIENTATION=-